VTTASGSELTHVTLRDLAELRRRSRGESPVAGTRGQADYVSARNHWVEANAPIVEEFFGDELDVAAILAADGRLHLAYRAGTVAEIEPKFAELLTRIEFVASQADIFLQRTYSATSTAPPRGAAEPIYYANAWGRAEVGIQLFATARYALDFVDYAAATRKRVKSMRASGAEIRNHYGLPSDPSGRFASSAVPDINDVETEKGAKAKLAAAEIDRDAESIESELNRLTAAAAALVAQRLSDAESSVSRQARTRYTRTYVAGVGIGLLLMAMASICTGMAIDLWQGPDDGSVSVGVAIGAGAIGAFISVLTRLVNARLQVDQGASRIEILIGGASRAFIGGVFGGVVFAFGASGLVSLPTGTHEAPPVFLWAALGFVAGFSERWVRDLIGTVEGTTAPTNLG
jgi:hypothetical protein